jgi:hypothetical protein
MQDIIFISANKARWRVSGFRLIIRKKHIEVGKPLSFLPNPGSGLGWDFALEPSTRSVITVKLIIGQNPEVPCSKPILMERASRFT